MHTLVFINKGVWGEMGWGCWRRTSVRLAQWEPGLQSCVTWTHRSATVPQTVPRGVTYRLFIHPKDSLPSWHPSRKRNESILMIFYTQAPFIRSHHTQCAVLNKNLCSIQMWQVAYGSVNSFSPGRRAPKQWQSLGSLGERAGRQVIRHKEISD